MVDEIPQAMGFWSQKLAGDTSENRPTAVCSLSKWGRRVIWGMGWGWWDGMMGWEILILIHGMDG